MRDMHITQHMTIHVRRERLEGDSIYTLHPYGIGLRDSENVQPNIVFRLRREGRRAWSLYSTTDDTNNIDRVEIMRDETATAIIEAVKSYDCAGILSLHHQEECV